MDVEVEGDPTSAVLVLEDIPLHVAKDFIPSISKFSQFKLWVCKRVLIRSKGVVAMAAKPPAPLPANK